MTSAAPARVRRLALTCALAAAAVGLFGVASDALATARYTTCDNLAGECLRMRQQLALQALGLAAALSGLACLWAAGRALVIRAARWQVLTLVLAVALIGAVHAVNPVDRLDNRWSGWLSDHIHD